MLLTISLAGVQISYFLDLQIKSYGFLKILEVWTRRACARVNEEELTTYAKICGQEEGAKNFEGLI
jgi:hypothetical protein